MTHHIDTHDDVALRDEETIAFWAMSRHFDDRVPCNVTTPEECRLEARWAWYCGCGQTYTECQTHRAERDAAVAMLNKAGRQVVCGDCGKPIPDPIPWLPM